MLICFILKNFLIENNIKQHFGIMINFIIYLFLLLNFSLSICTDIGCKTKATMFREIEREGFHITVHSLIELVVDVESAWKWEKCSILLRENISNSFYANPDQLMELNRSRIIQACTPDKINIETPRHLSTGHLVYIYGEMKRSQNLIFVNLNFPLHLRYHEPKVNGGYSMAELKPPVLLLNCPNVDCKNLFKSKAPCSLCGNEMCSWMRIPFNTNKQNITLPVPVGNLNHLWIIKFLTYFLTFSGSIYIILSVILTNC